ncbi:MAG: glycosyltransferase family 2 protein [Patescibacteria group bacterium]
MSKTRRNQLSVVINVRNSAETFGRCLESIKFAQEIIVVDMESTDNSVEIAKRYTDKIFCHKNVGYADPARNFALSKATQPWIFVIDADEEVSSSLKDVIIQLSEQSTDATGYYFPRKNIVSRKWIEHTGWWPDYQLRLFKNGSVKWAEGVHRQPDVLGKVVFLPEMETNAILHHNYQDLSCFIDRLNRYTSLHAQERTSLSITGSSLEEKALKKFFDEFIQRYFAYHGYCDGLHGTTLSLAQAFYELSVFFKQFELKKVEGQENNQLPVKFFRQLNKDLNYWLADYQCGQTTGMTKFYWKLRRKLCL